MSLGLTLLPDPPVRFPLVEFELRTGRGLPFRVLRSAMPAIDEVLLNAVVYIYPSVDEAKMGTRYGGSGFLVAVMLDPPFGFVYAVTNKHVINKGSTVVRVNTHDGKADEFPLTRSDWELHPKVDLAVAQIMTLNHEVHNTCQFPSDLLLSRDVCKKLKISAGDDLYMLGRFISHDGKQRNQPFVQSGIISLMPTDVVTGVDDDGNPTETQELFLVEMRSLSGCSGSPVIFEFPLTASTSPRLTDENRELITKRWLVGIDRGHFMTHEEVKLDTHAKGTDRYEQTQYVAESNAGQMQVVPVWYLQEMLNLPRFADTRKAGEEMIAQRKRNSLIVEDVQVIGDES